MKTNLFKKIGAMVTAVAMLASLGTVAYADASISITSATVGAPDSNNVRLVTVTYSATGVTGDVAVLGYVGTGENDSATAVAYDDTKHTIVGIEQEAVKTSGETTINFSVKYAESSTEQSNVFNNENLIVTLGAQGVSQAAMTTIPLAYEAPATSWTASTAAFASTDAISADVAYNADEAAKKTAAETELDKLNVTFSDDNGNTATTTLGALKTAGKVTYTPAIEGNVFTYTIAFKAGDSGLTTGTGEDALSVIFGDNLSVIKVVNINVQAAPVELTGKVEISSAAEAKWDPTAELFTVTVPYGYKDTGVKTSPEVAMMAYISNGTATTPAFTTDEEKDFTNQTEMKIIGIMQHTDSETNGGEFVYKVSGEIGANTYMVVKVGAQGTTFGSDMIAIPLSKDVPVADWSVENVTGNSYTYEQATTTAFEDVIKAMTVAVKKDDTTVDSAYALTNATVTATAGFDSDDYAQDQTVVYTVTLAEGTTIAGEALPADVTFTVTFTVSASTVLWDIVGAELTDNNAMTAEILEVADIETAVEAAAKAEIIKKGAVVTNGLTDTAKKTAAVTLTDAMITGAVTGDASPYTYTADIAIPTTAELTGAEKDNAQWTNAVTIEDVVVTVSVTEVWNPDEAEIADGITVAEATADAVLEALQAKNAILGLTTDNAKTFTLPLSDLTADDLGDLEAVTGETDKYTVEVTIPADYDTNSDVCVINSAITFTVTVTVQETGTYGDVYNAGDGVNGRDSIALARALAGGYGAEYEAILSNPYADVYNTGDGVNGRDSIALARHLAGGYEGYDKLPVNP